MTLDNTRKSWFEVFHDGKRIGGFAETTEQYAWDRAQEKFGQLGTITIKELNPELIRQMRVKLEKAKMNGGSSI